MVRFLLRALGFSLLALAYAALVVDGSRSIAGGRVLFYALGDAAAWLGAGRDLAAASAGWPEPVRRLAAGVGTLPASPVAVALGLLSLFAGGAARAGVGFSGRGA